MMKEVEEAITEKAMEIWKTVPENIKELISLANSDLYSGPIYLNKDNEETSMFDSDYDHAFDFVGACREIGDWMDGQVSDFIITECGSVFESEHDFFKFYDDLAKDDEREEDEEVSIYPEYYKVEATEILHKIVGKELTRYLN